jgi:hypothetical protein
VGAAVAIEPEPDLLKRLRDRPDLEGTMLTMLGTDRDLPILGAAGCRPVDLITVANARGRRDFGWTSSRS